MQPKSAENMGEAVMSQTSAQATHNLLAFRGMASLCIVLGHLLFIPHYSLGFASYEDWGQVAKLIFFRFIAVDGFFALSGCVLCLHYWDAFTHETPAKAFDRFYLRRLARIYPMHLVAMSMVAAYALLGVPHPISSGLEDKIFSHWQWTGLLNLLLMNGWGIVPVASWNEPSWTLSVLFMLYVIFPNLVLGMRRLPQSVPVFFAIIFLFLGGYTALRLWVGLGSQSDGAGALARGVAMFVCGMALARLHQLHWRQNWNWDRIAAVSCAALLVLIAAWWEMGQFDLWPMHLCVLVLLFCALRAQGRFAHLVANRISCGVGRMSFSLYILHYPVMMGLTYLFGEMLPVLAMQGSVGLVAAYVLSVASVLGLAYLGWRYLEMPLNRLMKRV